MGWMSKSQITQWEVFSYILKAYFRTYPSRIGLFEKIFCVSSKYSSHPYNLFLWSSDRYKLAPTHFEAIALLDASLRLYVQGSFIIMNTVNQLVGQLPYI